MKTEQLVLLLLKQKPCSTSRQKETHLHPLCLCFSTVGHCATFLDSNKNSYRSVLLQKEKQQQYDFQSPSQTIELNVRGHTLCPVTCLQQVKFPEPLTLAMVHLVQTGAEEHFV